MDLDSFKRAVSEIKFRVTSDTEEVFGSDLLNVTLMGSTVSSNFNMIKQDMDFITVIDNINVKKARRYGKALALIKSDAGIRVEWTIRDGPWKPEVDGRPLIAIHMNLETPMGIWRRATHQTNLAMGMFLNCQTLYGRPLKDFFRILPYGPQKALSDYYTFPWLKGLIFSAAAAPERHRFEILQYAALSTALNYMFLKGRNIGRVEAANELIMDKPEWEEFLKKILENRLDIAPGASLPDLERAAQMIDSIEDELLS